MKTFGIRLAILLLAAQTQARTVDHGKFDPNLFRDLRDQLVPRTLVYPDSVFRKFKERHEATRKALREAALALDGLQKTGDPAPIAELGVAVASELIRLKRELPLLEALENGKLAKGEHLRLMADSAVVMEFAELLARYTLAAAEKWKERKDRKLDKQSLLDQASRAFDTYYTPADQLSSVFYDEELRSLSPDSKDKLVLYRKLFGFDAEKAYAYRTAFFPHYAMNVIKKNRDILKKAAKPKP